MKDSADYAAYKERNEDVLSKFKFRTQMINEFKNELMPEIGPLIGWGGFLRIGAISGKYFLISGFVPITRRKTYYTRRGFMEWQRSGQRESDFTGGSYPEKTVTLAKGRFPIRRFYFSGEKPQHQIRWGLGWRSQERRHWWNFWEEPAVSDPILYLFTWKLFCGV